MPLRPGSEKDTAMIEHYEKKMEELVTCYSYDDPITFLARMVFIDKKDYLNSVLHNLREGN